VALYCTCIFCVFRMTLYWPMLQVICMHVRIVCLPVRAAPGECYYNALLCCEYFSLLSVVSHAFCALYTCIQSLDIILTPRLCLSANFVSFVTSIAELAHGEKSRTQSLTHSITHPAYLMPREPKLVLRKIFNHHISVYICKLLTRRDKFCTVTFGKIIYRP